MRDDVASHPVSVCHYPVIRSRYALTPASQPVKTWFVSRLIRTVLPFICRL